MKKRYTPAETRALLEALVSATFANPEIPPPARVGHIINTFHQDHGPHTDSRTSSEILGQLLRDWEARAIVRYSDTCSTSVDPSNPVLESRVSAHSKDPGATKITQKKL